MTRDAFYKAQEIEKKLDAVHQMQNIITNSTLASDEEYYKGHNKHVRNDEMILCYMSRGSKPDVRLCDVSNSYGCTVTGDFELCGNFMYGKDVPVELAERIERVLSEYESELNKAFDDLSGDYTDESTF